MFNFFKKMNYNAELERFNLQAEIENLQNQQNDYQHRLEQVQEQYNEALQDLHNLRQEVQEAEGVITMSDMGFPSIVDHTALSLTDAQKKVDAIQRKLAVLCGSNNHFKIIKHYKIDNSDAKGEQFQKIYCENIYIGFNTYFQKRLKAVTLTNFEDSINYISKKFNSYNKNAKMIGISLASEYLAICLDLLEANLELKLAKQEEKEQQKLERQRLKEQERLLEEAQKAKLAIQKERRMYEQSLAKSISEQEKANFEAKLKELDKREADIDYRVNNAKAGYLYVISTPAMPGCCKLGVTRRLNPLQRVAELSSASVPYPFVCHALVFSDNVFELETNIHDHFDKQRTNPDNKHKEFFNITPTEAIEALQKEFNCNVYCLGQEDQLDEGEANV